MGAGNTRRSIAVVAVLGVLGALTSVAAIVAADTGSGSSKRPSKEEAEGRFAEFNGLREAKFEGREGKEERRGPKSPAAEQVADRAYPRNYVDDRVALQSRQAFNRVLAAPSTQAPGTRAIAQLWKSLGPVTPN